MERVRYAWSKRDIGQLSRLFGSQGFEVIESKLPKPEIQIGYKERIEVVGEKCKAFLDPNMARITSEGQPTNKDSELQRMIDEHYSHNYSVEQAVIYPLVILGTIVTIVLTYRR